MADISKEDLRKEIAGILKGADLSSTSAKKVRQELEDKLGVKLQSRKKEIDDLVMEFVSAKQNEEEGEEDEEEEEEEEEQEDSEEDKKKKKRGSTAKKPPAKKSKKASDESGSEHSDDDGSEEEYSPVKAKPIKTRKLPPKKKKGSESDSDEDWSSPKKGKKGGGAKKGGGGGGYTKVMNLSPELAAVVGQDTMARHEVVKKIWSIIKEKDLYDPNNKQFAICDDALMKVIGMKRFRTFGMMKYLKSHFIS